MWYYTASARATGGPLWHNRPGPGGGPGGGSGPDACHSDCLNLGLCHWQWGVRTLLHALLRSDSVVRRPFNAPAGARPLPPGAPLARLGVGTRMLLASKGQGPSPGQHPLDANVARARPVHAAEASIGGNGASQPVGAEPSLGPKSVRASQNLKLRRRT